MKNTTRRSIAAITTVLVVSLTACSHDEPKDTAASTAPAATDHGNTSPSTMNMESLKNSMPFDVDDPKIKKKFDRPTGLGADPLGRKQVQMPGNVPVVASQGVNTEGAGFTNNSKEMAVKPASAVIYRYKDGFAYWGGEGIGPSRVDGHVAKGWARTPAGAIAAASYLEFLIGLGGKVFYENMMYYLPADHSEYRKDAEMMREQEAFPPSMRAMGMAPAWVKLQGCDKDVCTIKWASTSGDEMVDAKGVDSWRAISTTTLVWIDGDWRIRHKDGDEDHGGNVEGWTRWW